MDNRIYIYTDGACKGNPGPGGWGALLKYKEHKKEINGFSKNTTNNIMELTAVIESLLIIKQKSDITIITDSNYVKDGITKWIANWKNKGWKTSNKKPVKNKDLWKKLDDLSNNHKIKWEWVRGHTGNPGNERADQLANEAIIKNLT
ncbi:MAG: ribonuclease HI [Candidatus Marinimicrobia bacterium]|jgi:ribonuclease HI|nr:ribonuclease HI [Candidatus Neomarinimicrobiota bacterium]|tara:strand:- start:4228 stop:4668 length:441 start_codon:yes stop_codon:yes gene_type:complete